MTKPNPTADSAAATVMTHAFFKALLFLGAGSIIHGLSGEQDIFKMGNLRKKLPITFITFTIGWAAILGLPPFSGFFSKDEIIYEAVTSIHANKIILSLVLIAAFLTAYYMTRLYVLVFFGSDRVPKKAASHLHESPLSMTLPLGILAALALAGGWFGAPVQLDAPETKDGIQYLVMAGSVLIALTAAFIAYRKYSQSQIEEEVRDRFKVDSFYGFVFGRGTQKLAVFFNRFVEEAVFQRIIRLTGAVVDLSGNILKVTQVGSAQAYLMMILLSIVAVLAWFYLGAEVLQWKIITH